MMVECVNDIQKLNIIEVNYPRHDMEEGANTLMISCTQVTTQCQL